MIKDDTEIYTKMYGPDCLICRHYRFEARGTCSVFPEGIPELIRSGTSRHREPVAGDNGVTWTALTREDIARRKAELDAED